MFFAKAILYVAMSLATFVAVSISMFAFSGMMSPIILIALIPYAFIWILLLVYGIE
jgi:hypothetical protein